MENESVDWSELCPELLSEIVGRLGTRPNVFNFLEVCRNWRLSLSSIPRSLPQLSPHLPQRFAARNSDFFSSLSRGTLHHLVADAVYLLQPRKNVPESSKPWLVTVEELYRGKLSIRLPLSRIRAKQYLNDVKFPETLNLSEFHVSLIASGFSLRAPEENQGNSANGGLTNKNKLILFANTNAIGPLSIKDYTALLWFDHGGVAWARLSRPSNWGYLAYRGEKLSVDDIVSFRGRVYAVDRNSKVYAVNYDSEWVEREKGYSLRVECIVNDGHVTDRRKRLVVDSSGVLYLLERINWLFKVYKLNEEFKVYKLNEEDCRLEEVVGVGDDRILFVGVDQCFFAPAANLPGCKGNRIIFTRDSFSLCGNVSDDELVFESTGTGMDFSIYNFEDGHTSPISGFPRYSDVLWPPPAWFCPEFKPKKLKAKRI